MGGGGGGGGRGGAAAAAGANDAVPYKSTKEFPSLGFPDSTDDVRGALGEDGMKALYAFVQQGGTLITEGNTSQILPEMNLTPGVKVESRARAVRARHDSPRRDHRHEEPARLRLRRTTEVPVYFSSGPVLNAGARPPVARRRRGRRLARSRCGGSAAAARRAEHDADGDPAQARRRGIRTTRARRTVSRRASAMTSTSRTRRAPAAAAVAAAAVAARRIRRRRQHAAVPGLTADPASSRRAS